MSDFFARQLQAVKDANRKVSQGKRYGIVYETKKGYARILIGQQNGEPYLTPWIPCNMRMGGARKSWYLKKNQTVMVHMPNADPAQAYFTPAAPNDEFPLPDHAETAGTEAETYQLDYLRDRRDPEQLDWWFTPEKGTVQQSQAMTQGVPGMAAGSSSQASTPPVGKYQAQDTSCGEGTKATAKVRLSKKKNCFTARVNGIEVRVSAHKDGAKIRTKDHWMVVTKDDIYCSKPPVIGEDPVENDDD